TFTHVTRTTRLCRTLNRLILPRGRSLFACRSKGGLSRRASGLVASFFPRECLRVESPPQRLPKVVWDSAHGLSLRQSRVCHQLSTPFHAAGANLLRSAPAKEESSNPVLRSQAGNSTRRTGRRAEPLEIVAARSG